MPTPFYHLSLAKELVTHPRLAEKTKHFLQAKNCAFLFGNTAPDVQVISGQAREETHFFSLPVRAGDRPGWELLLTDHPCLAVAEAMPATQAAFLAGYLCHLQADWLWIKDIFAPIFGPRCSWGTFHDRLYYHNILRTYLDQQILTELSVGTDACLSQATPEDWLSFIEDRYLIEWRDFLSSQLQPGAAPLTVEVFSTRQGISVPEFYALLKSEERMQREVFEHISLKQVQDYRQRVLDENVQLLTEYLAFTLHQCDILIEGSISPGVNL